MDVVELKVTGMSCDHCRRAVDQAVRAVAGVGGVAVDLEAGEVRVEFEGDREGTLAKVKAAIEGAGYQVAEG